MEYGLANGITRIKAKVTMLKIEKQFPLTNFSKERPISTKLGM